MEMSPRNLARKFAAELGNGILASRDLAGKRVVLTGASSGIGWYLATQLIGLGASVVVDGRRQERLSQLRLSVGNSKKLIAISGDICDSTHRLQLINTAVDRFGGIDLLINNAGVGAIGAFEHASPERLRQILEVDFIAAAELTRLAIPHLKKGSEPVICNVNSVLGYRGVPGKSEYCAAKFAMRGWSQSLRLELRQYGIDVVAVSPSTTRSEFFSSLIQTEKSASSPSLGSQSCQTVARNIIKAVRRRHLDSILSPGGKALVWLSQMLPRLTDSLLLRYSATA
jgi:short-subunit dehydrogenase